MVDDVLQKVSNEESKGENKESTITPDDFEFLRSRKSSGVKFTRGKMPETDKTGVADGEVADG